MVFCYQNCSDLLWEKIVLVIEKNFWNSRLKAENLQNFWEHENLFKPVDKIVLSFLRVALPVLNLGAFPIYYVLCDVICNCAIREKNTNTNSFLNLDLSVHNSWIVWQWCTLILFNSTYCWCQKSDMAPQLRYCSLGFLRQQNKDVQRRRWRLDLLCYSYITRKYCVVIGI